LVVQLLLSPKALLLHDFRNVVPGALSRFA
jgi:hypothetical protein